MKKINEENKRISNGFRYGLTGLTLSGGHIIFCPIHGIASNTLYLTSATTSALTEYSIAKPFTWIHEKQVNIVEDTLNFISPEEKNQYSGIERLVQVEEEHYHHNNAEKIVSGGNYLLMSISLYLLGRGIYQKITSK